MRFIVQLAEAKIQFPRLNHTLAAQANHALDRIDRKWLTYADRLASTSLNPKNKVAAVIFNRGKYIAEGINERKTHPYQAYWNSFSSDLHAEIAALIQALKSNNFDASRCSIAVSRIRKGGLLCSYPCRHCYPALLSVGIKHIVCYDYNDKPISIRL